MGAVTGKSSLLLSFKKEESLFLVHDGAILRSADAGKKES
jgi:hypothetical protein